MDYGDTLNLPKTDFPMKASLPEREPEILKYWSEIKLYEKVMSRNRLNPKFIFHDGPPYANGHIHIGTALNKILKDIVVKYKSLRGFHVPYTPGWDTHGLPIELKAMEQLKGETDPLKIRKTCREYASKFQKIQQEQFVRLGTLADYANPYLTFLPEYEAKELEVFLRLVERGFVYKNRKPIHWCPHCVTALAEAEIEYEDHKSPSIFVRFKLKDSFRDLPAETYFVIWTTTPWTLPGNVAICLHPDFDYVSFAYEGAVYIVAEGLYSSFLAGVNFEPGKAQITGKYKGRDLEGLKAAHPFIERESLVILGGHVTLETGTGCVHTAPGHGSEDYSVGQKYNLEIISPVDERGRFDDGFPSLKGKHVEAANPDVVKILAEKSALLGSAEIVHQYPHCWRCKKPVIFRATPQWFIRVEEGNLRNDASKACETVRWIPEIGYTRITSMIANRPDWCISRQRVWGVPIPAVYCESCEEAILDPGIIGNVIARVKKDGCDCWWTESAESFIPKGFKCPKCGGIKFRKERDILDVWFDSGTSHWAVLNQWPDLSWPSDLYLEGSDQHRGWFQTSLLTSMAAFDKPPYRNVLTHGFVVDGDGRKMSKSLGNVIAPEEMIKQYGADVLRLWVASSDYQEDIRISKQIMAQMADSYRKIRNTVRFLLANLYDKAANRYFDRSDAVPLDEREELDRYIMYRLKDLTEKVTACYESYEFYKILQLLNNFCALDLSSFYLDIIKDRLYTSKTDSRKRRSAQSSIYELLMTLNTIIAPLLSFTAEEIWRHIPGEKTESVYLSNWPLLDFQVDTGLKARFDLLSSLKISAAVALEAARTEKLIGHSLDAEILIYSEEHKALLERNLDCLREILIVSQVSLRTEPGTEEKAIWDEGRKNQFLVRKAPGDKCPRCWQYKQLNGKEICPRCLGELGA
ncbi:MAG: isoleucine--tRNA ligase [Candidatus Wallbacteria bacterium]|nr:isoleucine--tRNA ligase [Candidatus Wallbacteria bacterium]